jgi:hypothetical protein
MEKSKNRKFSEWDLRGVELFAFDCGSSGYFATVRDELGKLKAMCLILRAYSL